MLYLLCGAARMVSDEVHDPALRMVVARRLLVQRGLHPSGSRELQQWSRQEIADRVQSDFPVDPVVVVAVTPEERCCKVENALAPYHDWRSQRLAERSLGVAREVRSCVLTTASSPKRQERRMEPSTAASALSPISL